MNEMKNESLENATITIMAIVGMLVVFIEKESLMYLSEEQLVHFIPIIVLDWYVLTAIIFFIMTLFSIRSTESMKLCGMNGIICIFSITFLIGNTIILLMDATHQYPSGLWSQIEFGLSAITPLGFLVECIFLFVIWKMCRNQKPEVST